MWTRRRSGFTIVELLIVIVIIGILAALTIIAFSNIQSRARDASRVADVDAVRKFLENYHAQNGHYMKSDNFLNANAAAALSSGPLKGLPPEALRGPKASSSTVSSWGQWGGDVTSSGYDYAIKSFTSTNDNCIGGAYADKDCTRYEIYQKIEATNSHKMYNSANN